LETKYQILSSFQFICQEILEILGDPTLMHRLRLFQLL